MLFATTAKLMATEATPGAFWRGLRLLAVDGTCWDVADSEANEARLRPSRQRPRDGPQRRAGECRKARTESGAGMESVMG